MLHHCLHAVPLPVPLMPERILLAQPREALMARIDQIQTGAHPHALQFSTHFSHLGKSLHKFGCRMVLMNFHVLIF